MSEQPFEEIEDDTPDPTDTVGPSFEQVEERVTNERQDDWSSEEIPAPELDEDESVEDPA